MSLWAEGSHLGVSAEDSSSESVIEDTTGVPVEAAASSQKHRLRVCEEDEGLNRGWGSLLGVVVTAEIS